VRPKDDFHRVEHLIVLMLENRSFDHMLGFADIPGVAPLDPTHDANWTEPPGGGTLIPASPDSDGSIRVDPSHSHCSVLEQMGVRGPGRSAVAPDNSGFVRNYERQASGEFDRTGPTRSWIAIATSIIVIVGLVCALYRWWLASGISGLIALVFNWVGRKFFSLPAFARGQGPMVMQCIAPENAPVLVELAREFAVFTNWYCSVPGETWPNRQFVHSATSHGTVNIEFGWYLDTTVFEMLENSGVGSQWHIYFDGPPQVACFRRLLEPRRLDNWYETVFLFDHIKSDRLPTYSFVEPNHGYLGVCNSQHPANNTKGRESFALGEQLIARIYNTLKEKPEVFRKTAFLITYDEHGGTYDRQPPPQTVSPGNYPEARSHGFNFELLGPRVPAVLVSPLIPRNTVRHETYDHSSVPATLRAMFAPDQQPLTDRDEVAATFESVFTAPVPRVDDLPEIDEPATPLQLTKESPFRRPDALQRSLTRLMEAVQLQLTLQMQDAALNEDQATQVHPADEPKTFHEGKTRAAPGYKALLSHTQDRRREQT